MNMHELEFVMNDHKIDILALNETRLEKKVEDRVRFIFQATKSIETIATFMVVEWQYM